MQSSSEQPLVGEEHCVTTLITAAKETTQCAAVIGTFRAGFKFSRFPDTFPLFAFFTNPIILFFLGGYLH